MFIAPVGIIGAGPAGVSAAVQLKRYKIPSVLFEKRKIGGLIENAHRVENTMLFPNGLRGREFVKILEEYARKYELNVIYEEAKKIRKGERIIIKTENREYEFDYLIVSTGTRPRTLPFPEVKYHITEVEKCDKILIIGGGDIAFDYALSASEKCKEVTLIYRSTIKALPVLADEVMAKGIKIVRGAVEKIENGMAYTSAGIFEFDEVLAGIGRIPNVEIVEGIADSRIFVIGDAKNGIYRQSSLAIADGIRTAMKIWRVIKYGDTE